MKKKKKEKKTSTRNMTLIPYRIVNLPQVRR